MASFPSPCVVLLVALFQTISLSEGFVPSVFSNSHHRATTTLRAEPKRQTAVIEDEEKPAGIGGAEFFGGNKQKEEFFDPVAEEQASSIMLDGDTEDGTTEITSFNRFDASESFEVGLATDVAKSLQSQINSALYERARVVKNTDYTYSSSSFQWTTPFSKANSPMEELSNALGFYKNVDVAIVGGKQTSDYSIQLDWEISMVWPTFWSPRVLLLGTSDLRLNGNNQIVQQRDALLDNADLLNTIGEQIKPRFWDWYHIGMTPSAEQMPRIGLQKPFLANYQVYEMPSRLTLVPSILEVGGREDRNAQAIPNHAFSCIIKTMGPTRQRYVPTTPVEVQIIPGGERLKLKWSIPLAVEFQTNEELPLPGSDPEALGASSPECTYELQPRRKVATVSYGGNPQDVEVTEIRKNLYEKVVKDGLKPKLDENGRPIFFFLDNTTKACYTDEGLGMCVYEWRPKAVEANEVGIDLQY